MDQFTIGHGTPCPYMDVICNRARHAVPLRDCAGMFNCLDGLIFKGIVITFLFKGIGTKNNF